MSENSDSSSDSSSSSSDGCGDISDFNALHLEDTNDATPGLVQVEVTTTTSDASVVMKGLTKEYAPVKSFPSILAAKNGIENREIVDQLWTRGFHPQNRVTKSASPAKATLDALSACNSI